MPIRPENRWLYPIDWAQLSDVIRFDRAGARCEHCSRPQMRRVAHLGDGRWWDADAVCWRSGRGKRCGSAWKKDPGSGVIGVEKGPLIPVV